MVASRGKSLCAIEGDVAKVGSSIPSVNFHLTERKVAFTEKLKADPAELSGARLRVLCVRTAQAILDDGSWVCYRLSGTEPVVRAYTEARNEKDMVALRTAAEKFVLD
jgi:phosphomannomutase